MNNRALFTSLLGLQTSTGYLLDDYPGASGGYSLRLLTTGYGGDCMKVRRDSDNAEQDIGFVSDVLDTASITSFCGGAASGINGYISAWYDQSGNAHNFVEASATNQMQIVSNGDSFYMWNGHPRIYEAGRKWMKTGAVTTIPAGWSGTNFSCAYPGAHSNWFGLFTGGNAGQYFNGVLGGATYNLEMREYYTTILATSLQATASQFNLVTTIWNDAPGDCELFLNGVSGGSVDTYTPKAYNNFTLPYSSSTDEADPVELIFYPFDVGADRSAINTNISDYYGF